MSKVIGDVDDSDKTGNYMSQDDQAAEACNDAYRNVKLDVCSTPTTDKVSNIVLWLVSAGLLRIW